MRKRWIVTGLLLAILAVAYVLVSSTPAETPRRDEGSDATSEDEQRAMLEGRSESDRTSKRGGPTTLPSATEKTPAPESRLAGYVKDDEGKVVYGAKVVLLPKELAGVDSLDGRINVDSNIIGHWSLYGHDVRGHWIAAFNDGYTPGYYDGDVWKREQNPITVTLSKGHPVEVHVETSDGEAPEDVRTWIAYPQGTAVFKYPGPEAGSRLPFHPEPTEIVLADGSSARWTRKHKYRVFGTVRMAARARSTTHYADPEETLFGVGDASVTIHMRPSCYVEVAVTDASTGAPVGAVNTFEIYDEHGLRVMQQSGSAYDGSYLSVFGIRPGRYEVRVESDGYVPWSAQIDVRSGEVAEIPVALEKDLTVGKLRIAVTEHSPAKEHEHRSRFVLARRRNVEGAKWESLIVSGTDNAPWEIEGLKAGEYDLFAWEAWTETVAFLSPVRILPRVWNNASMTLEPGLMVPPKAFWSRDFARFELRGGGIEGLPPVVFPVYKDHMGKRRYAPSMSLRSDDKWPFRDHNAFPLGPYPFAWIEIRETNKDGTVKKLRWPR